jgi:hypothetical protein
VRRPGVVLTVAIAWVGVALGHLAAYVLTYPNQTVRHIHLTITGHSWLGLATASLLAVIPVIVLAVVVRALRTGVAGPAGALRLASIQVPAFGLVEILERGSFEDAVADPAVFVGLALQIVFAVLGAWLVEVLGRAALAVACKFALPRGRDRSRARPHVGPSVPRLHLLSSVRRRGPPALASI